MTDPIFPEDARFPERREVRRNKGTFVIRYGPHNRNTTKAAFRGVGQEYEAGEPYDEIRVIRPDGSVVRSLPSPDWPNWSDETLTDWLRDIEVMDPIDMQEKP